MAGRISLPGMTIHYEPNSFWDRVVEIYAGPHDMFNSTFAYDALGNIDASRNAAQRALGEAMNYLNVFVATPFAAATVGSQYGAQLFK